MAPANTGKDNNSRKAVIKTDQTNSGNRCMVIPGPRIFNMVVMKFNAPKILLAPETCKLKMAKSTDAPEWLAILDKGG